MYDDLAGFFIGFLAGIVDDLLLQGKRTGLGFLPEAFNELGPGFFRGQGGDLFQPADMLFLVFLQFGPLVIDHFYLPVQVLLNDIIVLRLFLQGFQLLIDPLLLLNDALLFLLDTGFRIVDLPVLFEDLAVMICL